MPESLRRIGRALAVAAATLAVSRSYAQCVIDPVGGNAFSTTLGGVSGNGQVLVGTQNTGSSVRPYKWTAAAGIQYLSAPGAISASALAVNGDGTVIAGWSRPNGQFQAEPVIWGQFGMETIAPPNGNASVLNPSGSAAAGNVQAPGGTVYDYRPFMWSQSAGLLIADRFPGHPGPGGPDEKGSATSISDSGTVVAGYAFGANEYRVFRWTRGGAMQDLASCHGTYPQGYFNPTMNPIVSADGAVVVAVRSDAQFQPYLFRWTSSGGAQDLGTLGGGTSHATAMNASGSVVVGSSTMADGLPHAFRWTSSGGMADLGVLHADGQSAAFGVSADGAVVFGLATSAAGIVRVFRWTAATGMQDAGAAGGPFFDARAKIKTGANGQVLATSMSNLLLWRWAYSGSVPECNLPRVDSITPATGPTSGSTLITIAGANLSGASVSVGSSPATSVTVNSAGTSLTARTPAGSLGPCAVTLTTPSGTVIRDNGFTYIGVPAISSVTPSSGPAAGGTTVTVAGAHLTGAAVTVGGVAATEVVVSPAGTSLTARTPSGSAGLKPVSVTTTAGTATLTSGFTYVSAPTIASITPAFGPAAGGTAVTIAGTNLLGCTVRIGGTLATGVTVNPAGTSVSAVSPAGSIGAATVEVSTVGGTASRASAFTYTMVPTIASVVPSSGPPSGGTVLTLTGTHLQGAAVKVGATSATNVSVNASGTSLTAQAPAGSPGAQSVSVTTLGGTASQSGAFTYLGVPTNVQASDGTSSTQVNVTWGAVQGATGYRVLRAVGSGTPAEVGSVDGGSTLSYADSYSSASASPQYGQVYSYSVRTMYSAGPSAPSSANSGHLKMRAPTGVSATDGTSAAHVLVTWSASPGASGYQVFRAVGTGAPAQVGTTAGPLNFTDATAVPGQLCTYTVKATGLPTGNTSDSSASDSGYRALAAPTNVAASDGTSAAHVAVTWTATTGATGYKVFRDGSETPLQSGITGTTFNDASAVPGVSYSYAVRAVATAGDSPLSGSNAGYRQMTAPANVQASDGTLTTGIAVTWSPVAGAVTYQVFRSGTSAAAGTTASTEFMDTAVGTGHPVAGASYTYTVKAVGAATGATSPSSAGNAGYRSLTAPTGVAASDGTSTANVAVTWTGVAGATGYRIRRASVGSGVTTDIGNASATTFNDTTATPGTWFTYSVAATTTAGPSLSSAGENGHRALSAPTNVQATDGTSTVHVTVTWTASTGAANYRIFRRTGSDADEQVGTANAPALVFNDTSAVPGTSYNYSVAAVGPTPPDGLTQPVSAKSAVNAGYRQMAASTGVLASDGTSAAHVAVTWTAVPGAVSYQVLRGTTIVSSGSASTTFDDTGATQGTRFSYTVKAVGAATGATGAASTADFGYRNRPGPTNVQATDTDTAKVRITWTLAASGTPAVSGYEVRRIEGAQAPVTLTSALSATATLFDDVTAVSGTTYTYEVRARYTLASSSPAQVVTTLPGTDTGIRPSAFGSGDGGLAGDAEHGGGPGDGTWRGEDALGSDAPQGQGRSSQPMHDATGNPSQLAGSRRSGTQGESAIEALPCHDVTAALIRRIMALQDEFRANADQGAVGDTPHHALAHALESLLEPMPGERDATETDCPHGGIPMACVMAGGDINLDGTVDGHDFAAFMDAWAARDEIRADLDRDGLINGRDLALALAPHPAPSARPPSP